MRRFAAPRIISFAASRRTISGAVPLLFCGERLPCPARIGRGLGVTHIDWPLKRQRDFLEHTPVNPSVAALGPEHRMRHRMSSLPIPVIVAPKGASLVAASLDEVE